MHLQPTPAKSAIQVAPPSPFTSVVPSPAVPQLLVTTPCMGSVWLLAKDPHTGSTVLHTLQCTPHSALESASCSMAKRISKEKGRPQLTLPRREQTDAGNQPHSAAAHALASVLGAPGHRSSFTPARRERRRECAPVLPSRNCNSAAHMILT